MKASNFITFNSSFRIRIVLSIVSILCFFKSFSQEPSDTVRANVIFAKGDSLKKAKNYNLSIKEFQKAAIIYEQNEIWEKYASSYYFISDAYFRIGQYVKGTETAEAALNKCENLIQNPNSLNLANLWQSVGINNRSIGKFDKAINALKRSSEIKRQIPDLPATSLASSYISMGLLYKGLRSYDSAIIYFKKAMTLELGDEPVDIRVRVITNFNMAITYTDLRETELSLKHLLIAKDIQSNANGMSNRLGIGLYNQIGGNYYFKGDYDGALEYYLLSLESAKNAPGQNLQQSVDSHMNIALLYNDMGKYELALEYYKRAQLMMRKIEGNKSTEASLLSNIGLVYYNKGEYDKAIELYKSAIDLIESNFGTENVRLANYYINVGNATIKKGDNDGAVDNFLTALNIKSKAGENRDFDSATLLKSLADAKSNLREFDESLAYAHRAESIYKDLVGERHPNLASVYYSISYNYNDQKNYDKAILFIQKALITNTTRDFQDSSIFKNPTISQALDKTILLRSFIQKASYFHNRYKLLKDQKDLELALATVNKGDSIIKEQRKAHLQFNDKVDLGRLAFLLYDEAIGICTALYDLTKDNKYKEWTFIYSEENKSSVLKDDISNVSAKKFGGIPDSLLALEDSINVNLSYYLSQIQKERVKKENVDTLQLLKWENKLFQLNRRSDSLTRSFEDSYPNYYKLRYDESTNTVKDVQNQLDGNTVLFDYFLGKRTLYVFTITNNNFEINKVEADSTFNKEIDFLNKFIGQGNIENDQLSSFQEYVNVSHSLYKKLLAPLDGLENIEKIKILPDGELGYIPFEVLITEKEDYDLIDYRSLKYLIKQYEISYAYTSNLNTKYFKSKKKQGEGLISFAPSYNSPNSDSLLTLKYGQFRDAVVPLEWNQKEAEKLSAYFQGNIYTGQSATESEFKKQVNNFNIIHLATHAFIDDDNPMNSKFIFSHNQDTVEDGSLHAFELFNMNLNAELAVLSACQTGYGQLAKGEGVMSLARAFSYAGVPSIAMSHWQVDDQATSELMDLFFQNLSEGMRKSEALRQAKLDFLKTANVRKTHPFFWSSFVIIGDDSPLESTINYQRYYWYAFGLLLIILGCIYFLKKGQTNIN